MSTVLDDGFFSSSFSFFVRVSPPIDFHRSFLVRTVHRRVSFCPPRARYIQNTRKREKLRFARDARPPCSTFHSLSLFFSCPTHTHTRTFPFFFFFHLHGNSRVRKKLKVQTPRSNRISKKRDPVLLKTFVVRTHACMKCNYFIFNLYNIAQLGREYNC